MAPGAPVLPAILGTVVLGRGAGPVRAQAEVLLAYPAPMGCYPESPDAFHTSHVVAPSDLVRRCAATGTQLGISMLEARPVRISLCAAQAHRVRKAAGVRRMAVSMVEAEPVVAVSAFDDGPEPLRHKGHRVAEDAAAVQVRAARALPVLIGVGPLEQGEAVEALDGLWRAKPHDVVFRGHPVAPAACFVLHRGHVTGDAAVLHASHGARDVRMALLEAGLQPLAEAEAAEVVALVAAPAEGRPHLSVDILQADLAEERRSHVVHRQEIVQTLRDGVRQRQHLRRQNLLGVHEVQATPKTPIVSEWNSRH
mmetsp:Transcript_8903/g.33613  ORF Transcript_8903/g.33613 Transcript_8903/m.33613 type:complete len:310 (+) Transcript_8903:917-1846(+)